MTIKISFRDCLSKILTKVNRSNFKSSKAEKLAQKSNERLDNQTVNLNKS